MAKKKKQSSHWFLNIAILLVLVIAVFYAGNYLGKNEAAFQEGKDALLEVIPNIPDEVEMPAQNESENTQPEEYEVNDVIIEVSNEIDLSTLPISTEFGNPQDLGDGKITYSDLRGLEIQKTVLDNLTCETLGDHLDLTLEGYYWWNTCRDVVKGEGISVFVLTLVEDEYVYEKRYFLGEKDFSGSFELVREATGDIEDKLEFIKQKNTELKETHENYGVLSVVDNLFVELTK